MSIKLMSDVWRHSQHSKSALIILLALADQAQDDGFCWPSIDKLAKKARVSRRTVLNVLDVLEQSEELSILRNWGHKGNNLYHVTPYMGDHLTAPIDWEEITLPDRVVESGVGKDYPSDASSEKHIRELHPNHNEQKESVVSSSDLTTSVPDDSGEIVAPQISPSAAELFQTWNQNVGPIEQLTAERLIDLAEEVEIHRQGMLRGLPGHDVDGYTWVTQAIRAMVIARPKRMTIRYVEAIIGRWVQEGYEAPMRQDGTGPLEATDTRAIFTPPPGEDWNEWYQQKKAEKQATPKGRPLGDAEASPRSD